MIKSLLFYKNFSKLPDIKTLNLAYLTFIPKEWKESNIQKSLLKD